MSHVAVRLLADRFAHETEGVNYWTAQVPRFAGDRIPEDATIYDETRDDWVSRGAIPRGTDGDEDIITTPAWIIFAQSVQHESGIPGETSTDARTIRGTVTIVAQLVLQDVDSAKAATDGMYMLRAGRGVLARFDDPDITSNDDRDQCGMHLFPATSIVQGQVKAFQDDRVVSPGSLVVTYPFWETAPLDPLGAS